MEHLIFYFLFEMDGKYYELEGKMEFSELTFSVPNTDITVTFAFDIENFFGWFLLPISRKTTTENKIHR
jgi:hypothetical protein